MNRKRLFLQDEAGTEQTKPTFKVVMAYDSRSAGTRAMNVFRGLVRKFGDDFEFHCGLWRFDVLGLPETREAAVGAGIAADLLIVAARCDTDLPSPVEDWLDQCVAEKIPGSAGLVALLDGRQPLSDFQCQTRQHLQRIADRAGLDFFCHEARSQRASPVLSSETLKERASTVSSVLEGILHRCEAPPRWRM